MSKNYVNNADLLRELELSRAQDKLTSKIIDMFYMMIDRIQRKLFYKDDNAREDCKAGAMLNIVEKWKQFDINEGTNAFSYFTSIIFNALAASWNRNEKRPIHISLNQFINNDNDD
jgi:hypothetical protein